MACHPNFSNFCCAVNRTKKLGVGVSYYIFVAENVASVIEVVMGSDAVTVEGLMVAMALIEVPLCLVKDLTRLAPATAAANAFISFSLVVIIATCLVSCIP